MRKVSKKQRDAYRQDYEDLLSAALVPNRDDYRVILDLVSDLDEADRELKELYPNLWKEIHELRAKLAEAEQQNIALAVELELATKEPEVVHHLRAKLATAKDALKEIAASTRWGEDTAIKRTITGLQDTAREALRSLEKREDSTRIDRPEETAKLGGSDD